MKKRAVLWGILLMVVAIGLSGCSKNPDTLFKKGKFAEAYPLFVQRAGTNEVALKREVLNGDFESRNKAGNQAIHDLYYAAECQKKQGNMAEAKMLYTRVVALSKYPVQIPTSKTESLKDAFGKMAGKIRDMRYQEQSYGRDYRDWQNRPPENTDPYDNGNGSGNTNTDPYDNGNSGNSNTDPYSNGNSGNSNTDPYSNSNSGGTNTDPYNNRVMYSQSSAPSDWSLRMAYDQAKSAQREFETVLSSVTAADMPAIDQIRREYDLFKSSLDGYFRVGNPGGLLFSPDSLASQLAYNSMQSSLDKFQRNLYAAQGNITYKKYKLQLKEPQLVTSAEQALREMGVDPATIQPAASAPSAPVALPANGLMTDTVPNTTNTNAKPVTVAPGTQIPYGD